MSTLWDCGAGTFGGGVAGGRDTWRRRLAAVVVEWDTASVVVFDVPRADLLGVGRTAVRLCAVLLDGCLLGELEVLLVTGAVRVWAALLVVADEGALASVLVCLVLLPQAVSPSTHTDASAPTA